MTVKEATKTLDEFWKKVAYGKLVNKVLKETNTKNIEVIGTTVYGKCDDDITVEIGTFTTIDIICIPPDEMAFRLKDAFGE